MSDEDVRCGTHKCPDCRAREAMNDRKLTISGVDFSREEVERVENEWIERGIIR